MDKSKTFPASPVSEAVHNRNLKAEVENVKQRTEGTIGPEVFLEFQRQVGVLDDNLRKLCNEARKLGSSAGILSASTRVRARLRLVLYLFLQNALKLYPGIKGIVDTSATPPTDPSSRWKKKNFLDFNIQKTANFDDSGNLSLQFSEFSGEVEALFQCFVQFPQFVEELPDRSLIIKLRSWALFLSEFQNESESHAVQYYLYKSMADIGTRLEEMAKKYVEVFTDIGIPTVRASQEHACQNLQNQTIIATLFAGTTASMIQLLRDGQGATRNAFLQTTSILWYLALILSVSSGINSLLALSWLQAIYRSPDHRMPWWVKVWIRRFPLASLILATGFFFLGLIFFVYASPQTNGMALVTTVFSSVSSFGLIVTSVWFTCELLVYTRYKGRVWLADILEESRKWAISLFCHWWSSVRARQQSSNGEEDVEKAGTLLAMIAPIQSDAGQEDPISFWIAFNKDKMGPKERAQHRWHEAVRRVIRGTHPKRGVELFSRFSHLTSQHAKCLVYNSMPKLRKMKISEHHQANEKHDALVRCLQFSPNGNYLVTSSWDSSSFVLRVGSPTLCEHVLPYPTNFGFVHQVEWSWDGQYFLTRSSRNLAIWDTTSEIMQPCVRQILLRPADGSDGGIRRAAWHGKRDKFFVVQGGKVLVLNLRNEVIREHMTPGFSLQDICVTSDSRWMICVGQFLLEESPHSLEPGIIVLDLNRDQIKFQVPLCNDTSDVTLACSDTFFLVSYENKTPSQCWRLDITKLELVDLQLEATYMPQANTSFAALPAIFGGEEDHLVLRVTTIGNVHIWDRDTAVHIHCIKSPFQDMGKLTSFTWNRGSQAYMFAIGLHDGTTHIWASSSEEPTETKLGGLDDDRSDIHKGKAARALDADADTFYASRDHLFRRATDTTDITLVSG